MMAVEEHRATALAFLDASDREFDAGDVLQASEKLWGALLPRRNRHLQAKGLGLWDTPATDQLAKQLVMDDGALHTAPATWELP